MDTQTNQFSSDNLPFFLFFFLRLFVVVVNNRETFLSVQLYFIHNVRGNVCSMHALTGTRWRQTQTLNYKDCSSTITLMCVTLDKTHTHNEKKCVCYFMCVYRNNGCILGRGCSYRKGITLLFPGSIVHCCFVEPARPVCRELSLNKS